MHQLTPDQLNFFFDSGTLISSQPGKAYIGWGNRKWLMRPEPTPGPLFYYPDFFLKLGYPWFTHEFWSEISLNDLAGYFKKDATFSIPWENKNHSLFQEQFDKLKLEIDSGRLQKAVPYVFETTKELMTRNRLESALAHALQYAQGYPVHLYGFWDQKSGMLGATPEMLFEMQKDKLKTIACAGTAPFGEKLTDDPKVLLEHQLVIQGISETLSQYGPVTCGKQACLALGSVVHLITPIEVKLSEKRDFVKVVFDMHPTPALGAYPKKEGARWMENYQMRLNRRRLGAPAGYLFGDRSRCLVAIRNVQWDDTGMFIGAGCGVVAGSQCEAEWEELKLKLNFTKALLGL